MPLPIMNQDEIPDLTNIQQVHNILHTQGCRMCSLGFQPNLNGCCVSRGTFDTKKMIIGEAPGKEEDARGAPFTGPAGQLMDRIWASVGMDTNDWYLTNVVLCRPVAPRGHNKQNLTPKYEQKLRCSPFLMQQLTLLNPKIVVTVGAVATATVMHRNTIRIGEYRGKLREGKAGKLRFLLFPMLHPAAILHAKKDPEKHTMYRQWMWDDIRKLKQIVMENNL